MNERIKDLAKRAVETVATKRNLSDGQVERTWLPDDFNAVFAEFIIKECIDVVNLWSDEEPCSEGYDIPTVYRIKSHFGIQE